VSIIQNTQFSDADARPTWCKYKNIEYNFVIIAIT